MSSGPIKLVFFILHHLYIFFTLFFYRFFFKSNTKGPYETKHIANQKSLLAIAAGTIGAENVNHIIQKFTETSTLLETRVIIFAYDEFNWNTFPWSEEAIIIKAKRLQFIN